MTRIAGVRERGRIAASGCAKAKPGATKPTAAKAKPAAAKPKAKGKPAAPAPPKKNPTGYIDTPFLPGGKWRVHDDTRPRPKVVTPGEAPGTPPSDAIVLLDGKNLNEWSLADGSPATWTLKNGYMEVPPRPPKTKGADLWTKKKFGDCQVHIEFATPKKVDGNSQGRGNSGLFFADGRYEIQILDSYNNKTYADGQATALYGYKPPLVNASRKPGEWQAYDVIFEAARFDKDGLLLKKAYITVLHNGVVTQHRQPYLGGTGHKKVAVYAPHELEGRLKLQDHSNPTRFRNIWVRKLDLTSNE